MDKRKESWYSESFCQLTKQQTLINREICRLIKKDGFIKRTVTSVTVKPSTSLK